MMLKLRILPITLSICILTLAICRLQSTSFEANCFLPFVKDGISKLHQLRQDHLEW